jgi:sodium/bile acid cotransporter 7
MTNEKSNEESTTMMAASPEPEDPVEPQSEDDKKENVSQTEDGSESADKQEPSCQQKAWRKWCDFYAENEFVVLVIVVICLARAYPPLGADYLQPQITSTWIAVIFIFSTSTFSVSIRTLTSFLLSSYTCSFNISHGWSGFEN